MTNLLYIGHRVLQSSKVEVALKLWEILSNLASYLSLTWSDLYGESLNGKESIKETLGKIFQSFRKWLPSHMCFKGVKRNSDQPILRQESADKLFKYEIFIVSRQTSVNLNYLYRVRHIYTQVVDLSGYQNNSSSKQPSQYKTILVLLTQRYWIHTQLLYTFIQRCQLVILAPVYSMC